MTAIIWKEHQPGEVIKSTLLSTDILKLSLKNVQENGYFNNISQKKMIYTITLMPDQNNYFLTISNQQLTQYAEILFLNSAKQPLAKLIEKEGICSLLILDEQPIFNIFCDYRGESLMISSPGMIKLSGYLSVQECIQVLARSCVLQNMKKANAVFEGNSILIKTEEGIDTENDLVIIARQQCYLTGKSITTRAHLESHELILSTEHFMNTGLIDVNDCIGYTLDFQNQGRINVSHYFTWVTNHYQNDGIIESDSFHCQSLSAIFNGRLNTKTQCEIATQYLLAVSENAVFTNSGNFIATSDGLLQWDGALLHKYEQETENDLATVVLSSQEILRVNGTVQIRNAKIHLVSQGETVLQSFISGDQKSLLSIAGENTEIYKKIYDFHAIQIKTEKNLTTSATVVDIDDLTMMAESIKINERIFCQRDCNLKAPSITTEKNSLLLAKQGLFYECDNFSNHGTVISQGIIVGGVNHRFINQGIISTHDLMMNTALFYHFGVIEVERVLKINSLFSLSAGIIKATSAQIKNLVSIDLGLHLGDIPSITSILQKQTLIQLSEIIAEKLAPKTVQIYKLFQHEYPWLLPLLMPEYMKNSLAILFPQLNNLFSKELPQLQGLPRYRKIALFMHAKDTFKIIKPIFQSYDSIQDLQAQIQSEFSELFSVNKEKFKSENLFDPIVTLANRFLPTITSENTFSLNFGLKLTANNITNSFCSNDFGTQIALARQSVQSTFYKNKGAILSGLGLSFSGYSQKIGGLVYCPSGVYVDTTRLSITSPYAYSRKNWLIKSWLLKIRQKQLFEFSKFTTTHFKIPKNAELLVKNVVIEADCRFIQEGKLLAFNVSLKSPEIELINPMLHHTDIHVDRSLNIVNGNLENMTITGREMKFLSPSINNAKIQSTQNLDMRDADLKNVSLNGKKILTINPTLDSSEIHSTQDLDMLNAELNNVAINGKEIKIVNPTLNNTDIQVSKTLGLQHGELKNVSIAGNGNVSVEGTILTEALLCDVNIVTINGKIFHSGENPLIFKAQNDFITKPGSQINTNKFYVESNTFEHSGEINSDNFYGIKTKRAYIYGKITSPGIAEYDVQQFFYNRGSIKGGTIKSSTGIFLNCFGNVSAQSINHNAVLSLNLFSTFIGRDHLSINAGIALNIGGRIISSHLRISSFMSWNAGLYLPYLPTDLETFLTGDNLANSLITLTRNFSPTYGSMLDIIKSNYNLFKLAIHFVEQKDKLLQILKENPASLNPGNVISALLCIKDIAEGYTDLYSNAVEPSNNNQGSLTVDQHAISVLKTAIQPLVPSVSLSSLYSRNDSSIISANVSERHLSSENFGAIRAWTYSSQSWHHDNHGTIASKSLVLQNHRTKNHGEIIAEFLKIKGEDYIEAGNSRANEFFVDINHWHVIDGHSLLQNGIFQANSLTGLSGNMTFVSMKIFLNGETVIHENMVIDSIDSSMMGEFVQNDGIFNRIRSILSINELKETSSSAGRLEKTTLVANKLSLQGQYEVVDENSIEATESLDYQVEAAISGHGTVIFISPKGKLNGSFQANGTIINIINLENDPHDLVYGENTAQRFMPKAFLKLMTHKKFNFNKPYDPTVALTLIAAEMEINDKITLQKLLQLSTTQGAIHINADIHNQEKIELQSAKAIQNNGHDVISDTILSIQTADGNLENLGGTFQGKTKLQMQIAGDVNNVAIRDGDRYRLAKLLGGNGEANQIGLFLKATGRVLNDASVIESNGSNVIAIKGYKSLSRVIKLQTASTKHHGRFRGHESETFEETVFSPALVSHNGFNLVYAENGGIHAMAEHFISQLGTALLASQRIFLNGIKTTKTTHEKFYWLFGLLKRESTKTDETVIPTLIYDLGKSLFRSENGDVKLLDTCFIGKNPLTLEGINVAIETSIENHWSNETSRLLNLELFGVGTKAITQDSLVQQFYRLQHHSSNVVEGAANLWNLALNSYNTYQQVNHAYQNNNLFREFVSRFHPTAALSFKHQHEQQHYQTLGPSFIDASTLDIHAKNKATILGVPVKVSENARIFAKIFEQLGVRLDSQSDTKTWGFSLSFDPVTQQVHVGADVTQNKQQDSVYANQHFQVDGQLQLYLNQWIMQNANTTVGSLSGTVQFLKMQSQQSEHHDHNFSIGANTNGNFHFAFANAFSRYIAEKTQITINGKPSDNLPTDIHILKALFEGANLINNSGNNKVKIDSLTSLSLLNETYRQALGLSFNIFDFNPRESAVSHIPSLGIDFANDKVVQRQSSVASSKIPENLVVNAQEGEIQDSIEKEITIIKEKHVDIHIDIPLYHQKAILPAMPTMQEIEEPMELESSPSIEPEANIESEINSFFADFELNIKEPVQIDFILTTPSSESLDLPTNPAEFTNETQELSLHEFLLSTKPYLLPLKLLLKSSLTMKSSEADKVIRHLEKLIELSKKSNWHLSPLNATAAKEMAKQIKSDYFLKIWTEKLKGLPQEHALSLLKKHSTPIWCIEKASVFFKYFSLGLDGLQTVEKQKQYADLQGREFDIIGDSLSAIMEVGLRFQASKYITTMITAGAYRFIPNPYVAIAVGILGNKTIMDTLKHFHLEDRERTYYGAEPTPELIESVIAQHAWHISDNEQRKEFAKSVLEQVKSQQENPGHFHHSVLFAKKELKSTPTVENPSLKVGPS